MKNVFKTVFIALKMQLNFEFKEIESMSYSFKFIMSQNNGFSTKNVVIFSTALKRNCATEALDTSLETVVMIM